MATILYPLVLTLCLLGCVKGCVESERLALLDFKKSFPSFPQNHGKLSSWNSSEDTKDCCSWEGITCNDLDGHVESLDLSNQGLESYRLRPSVLELHHLKSLVLRENNLAMRIPEFIRSLSNLTNLDISDSGFFGMIPPQLGNLSNLQSLSIGSSNLSTDNFQWLSHLSYLEALDMSSTNFSEARDWLFVIRKLPVLYDFTCTSCYFPTPDFPSTFSSHFNSSSSSLRTLTITGSVLGPKFPSWLPALLDSITWLDISQCQILGSIPIAFWKSLPSSLGYFNMSFNNLRGVVPNLPFEFFGVYPFTVTIDLTSNSFHGPIPPRFFEANELYLSKNKFSSFAPSPYSSNNISDFYSTSIVDISDNNLSGEIPQWVWSQSWMNSLNLANNNLSGILPSSTNASNMYALNLSNNNFSGPLPSLLKNCTIIRIVDLSGNKLSGSIPSWLGEGLNSLHVLSLQSNNFSGTLPSNLFNLSSLKILDLSHNKLSGNIPSCVDKLFAMVHHLNSSTEILLPGARNARSTVPVDEVEFYHAFVKWKGMDRLFQKNLEMLRLVDLSNNNFSGEVPTRLTSLTELDSLDLSSNNFEGSIPNQIGQLKSLEYLNLSYNKLSGPIPPSLSDISLLGMLDLSHNNLSGRIPKGTQLQGFDSSAYEGNSELCGLPLQVKCPGDNDDSTKPLQPYAIYESDMKEDKWKNKQSFYAGLGAGFACGFFGILGSLIWIRKWRCAFFQIGTRVGGWILLVVALTTSKITRTLWLK